TVVVRPSSISRTPVSRRDATGARTGGQSRRLLWREDRRDRGASRTRSGGLRERHPRASRQALGCRQRERQGGKAQPPDRRRPGRLPRVRLPAGDGGPRPHDAHPLPGRGVSEAWARPAATGTTLQVCVNRTPVTADVKAYRDKRDVDMFGCGITHTIAEAPKDKHFAITLNVITPYMPITSDGKAPNLEMFL